MKTYFAMDGSYGSAVGLFTIDTTPWSDVDWQEIDEVGDMQRLEVAMEIAKKYA